jgi:hypothetical protein
MANWKAKIPQGIFNQQLSKLCFCKRSFGNELYKVLENASFDP